MTNQVPISAVERALAHVRPMILGHGGNIELLRVESDGTVWIELQGACQACPSSAMTLAGPVRNALMSISGVTNVRCETVRASERALRRIARMLGANTLTDTDG
jgi:Fe-S cluster biogenesis protein NfuA